MANPKKALSLHTLPPELVYMIISHIYDRETLRLFSVASHLSRKFALPNIYHTLTIRNTACEDPKKWPKPLLKLHELSRLEGVSRFNQVKRLGIVTWSSFDPFTVEHFDDVGVFSHFSALKNLQELRIESLVLSSFMPNIKQYFGHFAPTLQSLALSEPVASCREILHFVGLFQKLRDLKLVRFDATWGDVPEVATPAPPPFPKPPLDGWLTLGHCEREEFVSGMIALYGKLRFRCVNLFGVRYMRRVLDECADTLETLQLHPQSDQCMPDLLRNSLWNFENHKSLRTLKLNAHRLPDDPKDAGSLNALLSLIKSPQLDVVMVCSKFDLPTECTLASPGHPGYEWGPKGEGDRGCKTCDKTWKQIRVLNEVCKARDFRLVIYLDITCKEKEIAKRVESFKRVEIVKKELELSDLLIISMTPLTYPYDITQVN